MHMKRDTIDRIVRRWCRTDVTPDAAEILEHVAYYLTKQYIQTASFKSRGVLLPWQQEALSIVINLQRECS